MKTQKSACEAVKAAVAAKGHVSYKVFDFCDALPAHDAPKGYYVLALHGKRPDCDGICSTNMGWFAVQKATGRVFEWDVGEWQVGAPYAAP